MIRQTLPWNVDYYRDRKEGVYENSEPVVQLHVGEYNQKTTGSARLVKIAKHSADHCLNVVRQQLQSSSDLGLFGQRWVQRPGKDLNVFPIFDTVHKCRNFDDIVNWVKENQAPDGLVAEVRNDDIVLEAYP